MSLLDHPLLAPTAHSARSTKRALGLTATLVLVVLAIMLPVMQSSDETTQGYKINSLQQQQSDLEAQIYQAQSEIAQLGALNRVDSDARNRLGMVASTSETSVTVSIPMPATRALPNAYLPAATASSRTDTTGFWQRLARLLPFS
jgi:cell division protein FtsB